MNKKTHCLLDGKALIRLKGEEKVFFSNLAVHSGCKKHILIMCYNCCYN